MNSIGFPNLGIGPFEINPTAVVLGKLHIQWYGLIIVLGMILACSYAFYRMKSLGMVLDNMLDVAIVCIPLGIVGARAYYVLTSLEHYDSFYEMIAIWNGGLAIYGGVIGGIIGIFAVCKIKKYNFLGVVDCIAPGVLIGQLVGRWGNFTNAEAFGVIGKYDFLGIPFDTAALAENNPLIMTINGMQVHPTFLYESLWNLVGFIIINALWTKKKYNGEVTVMYLAWYGLGRSIIEGFRGDSLYVGGIRVSQLLAFLCFTVGTVILVSMRLRLAHSREREQ